jgi:hypothetical protein
MYNITLRHFHENNKYYIFVWVCAHACVHACVWVSESVGVRVHVVLFIQHATHVHHNVTSFVASGSPTFFSIIA